MFLRKGIKREILLLLAYLVDEIDAYSFKNQLRWMFCEGWYKRSTFGSSVARLLSVGDIERVERKGELFYRLTSQGSKKLKESIPILKLAEKPWDERWRIVIFDIPEKNRLVRQVLREKLLRLGFGQWQRSVYLTPHDIEQEINQYLISKKLFPRAVCLVARRSDLGDDKKLANWVWKLDRLNEKYEEFIFGCKEAEKEMEEGKLKKGRLGELWRAYQELLFANPHLPKKLLPEDWLGDQAKEMFIQLCCKTSRSAPVIAKGKIAG